MYQILKINTVSQWISQSMQYSIEIEISIQQNEAGELKLESRVRLMIDVC